jgi:hypothetical protein
MFRAILETQWKWTRGAVLAATVLGFLIPLASLRVARPAASAEDFVQAMQISGIAYPLLAAALGLAVAVFAWGHDHRGRHVYALTLPIERWRYALMRFGAGGVFLLPPVIGVLAGAGVVALTGAIPLGLHAYPAELTLRFALGSAVAFAIFFAISASTARTAGLVLGVVAIVVFAQFLLQITGSNYDIFSRVTDALFGPVGMLSVFSGRWMLVDA